MAETISGISIPDSKLAQEATELVREFASQLIFDHSRRVFIFGALRGEQDGISYDPELLYVGAMFHDLGLTENTVAPTSVSKSTALMRHVASCFLMALPTMPRRRFGMPLHCIPPQRFHYTWQLRSLW